MNEVQSGIAGFPLRVRLRGFTPQRFVGDPCFARAVGLFRLAPGIVA